MATKVLHTERVLAASLPSCNATPRIPLACLATMATKEAAYDDAIEERVINKMYKN